MTDLRKAIECIIEECMKHEDCKECPLRANEYGCEIVENYPYEWRLKKIEKFPLRIFE